MTIVNIQIDDALYGPPLRALNQSGYILDTGKLGLIPGGVEEVDGWRERNARTDHQQQRLFKVPWSRIADFREWAIGYSTTVLLPSAGLAAIEAAQEFNASIPPASPFVNTAVAAIQRVNPCQDPCRPWLFCTDCELSDAKGAVVQDPSNIVFDAAGNPVEDTDGSSLIATTIAYVENRYGGGCVDSTAGSTPSTRYGTGFAYFRLTYRPPEGNSVILNDSTIAQAPFLGNELGRYVIREEDFALDALPMTRLIAGAPGAVTAVPQQLTFIPGSTSITGVPIPAGVAGQMVPEAGTLQLATSLMKYTWLDVPDLPRAGFANCVGRINIGPFDGFNGAPTYDPETLLCLPWRFRPTRSIAGRPTWRIEYKFQFRATGWNYFPTPNGFFQASFGGGADGPFVYNTADFNQLFTIPPPVAYLPASGAP